LKIEITIAVEDSENLDSLPVTIHCPDEALCREQVKRTVAQAGLKYARDLRITIWPVYPQTARLFHPRFHRHEPMAGITHSMNMAHRGQQNELQYVAPGGSWDGSIWIPRAATKGLMDVTPLAVDSSWSR